jgi:hypothetical protein
MARENIKAVHVFVIKTGKKISVSIVFTYTVWSASLGFEKPIQSYSSFSNKPKTEIVALVQSRYSVNSISRAQICLYSWKITIVEMVLALRISARVQILSHSFSDRQGKN